MTRNKSNKKKKYFYMDKYIIHIHSYSLVKYNHNNMSIYLITYKYFIVVFENLNGIEKIVYIHTKISS